LGGGGAEFTDGAGFEQEWPLVPAGSDERFCRPGGEIQRERRGKTQRGFRRLNRRKRGKLLLSESMGFNRGRGLLWGVAGVVSGEISGQSSGMTCGATCQRGRGE
jgi:hypothetical protein